MPPHTHIYLLSGTELGLLHEFLDDMLDKGFIQSSQLPGGAPVLFAKKKDGTLRLCVDFRNLNKITQKDQYPIPLVTNLLDQLGSAKVYTKLDLCAGYYNVRVAAGHKWKTAFQMCYFRVPGHADGIYQCSCYIPSLHEQHLLRHDSHLRSDLP